MAKVANQKIKAGIYLSMVNQWLIKLLLIVSGWVRMAELPVK